MIPVQFVGAGPGGADLLTVRARGALAAADLVLYADSLVDPALLAGLAARGLPTAGLTLEAIVEQMVAAARAGQAVVRLHSGDPSLWGATREQMAALRRAGVPYAVVPGVPSAMAAAAHLGVELTAPGGAQTVVLTRLGGRTPGPGPAELAALAATGATLVVFLSVARAGEVVAACLAGGLSPETPAIVATRISWPDGWDSRGTLVDLEARVRASRVRRQALLLIGEALRPALAEDAARAPAPGPADAPRSRLYDPTHGHLFRPRQGGAVVPGRPRTAAVAITAAGVRAAARLQPGWPELALYCPAHLQLHAPGATAFDGPVAGLVADLWPAQGPLICFLAASAVVRLVAPRLTGKATDPPVVAVDEAGRFVVPLVGAHQAGGNRLARRVAAALDAVAVVTTASEARGVPAPDVLAAAQGWRADEPGRLARAGAALLAGEPLAVWQDAGDSRWRGRRWAAVTTCHPTLAGLRRAAPAAALLITDRAVAAVRPMEVLLRPQTLVLGIGCERGV
ncbi:MAG TPA: SAM-dependent methyltransferase, partial [Candidatus Dormibacteraeota bacterium]|nr:SAM-dependent methyltransferase [Candidatus Dormibacteraeota bacterium]